MKGKLEIEEAVQKIKKLDKEEKVQFIILYGSSAQGKRDKLSDIDLAVGYEGNKKKRFDFRIELSGELPSEFDIQIFQDLPLYLQREVLQGKVLFSRNLKELNETALNTIRDYEFFEPSFLDYIRG